MSYRLRLLLVCHTYRQADTEVSHYLGPQGKPPRTSPIWKDKMMRSNYDFSRARKNPYAKRLKKQITIRLDADTVRYFKQLAVQTGISYQTLINLYLRDCAVGRRSLKWA